MAPTAWPALQPFPKTQLAWPAPALISHTLDLGITNIPGGSERLRAERALHFFVWILLLMTQVLLPKESPLLNSPQGRGHFPPQALPSTPTSRGAPGVGSGQGEDGCPGSPAYKSSRCLLILVDPSHPLTGQGEFHLVILSTCTDCIVPRTNSLPSRGH